MTLPLLYPGSMVRATFTFLEVETGLPEDPTTVTIITRTPGDVEASSVYGVGDIVKTSTGVYYLDVLCAENGEWVARAVGTGDVYASTEVTWKIQKSNL